MKSRHLLLVKRFDRLRIYPRWRRAHPVRVHDRLWLRKRARMRKRIAWPVPPSAFPF